MKIYHETFIIDNSYKQEVELETRKYNGFYSTELHDFLLRCEGLIDHARDRENRKLLDNGSCFKLDIWNGCIRIDEKCVR